MATCLLLSIERDLLALCKASCWRVHSNHIFMIHLRMTTSDSDIGAKPHQVEDDQLGYLVALSDSNEA
ncbi:hypothetical protein EIP91_009068 [Steccherinum ochraceum]|uniref:Uncharacterized protein n=1 Tax=Steccherinum ochraceum TaxID=92696 RepID=A0A4R0R7M8_9APHY|nr:hypothetical protein EIP91_009068 [Steccherinum ochraceum]